MLDEWRAILAIRSYFDVADEVGLVEPEEHLLRKHEIKSFMLNVGIGQHVLVVPVQHPPQHLPVYLVLPVDVLVVLVYPEQLYHVEPRLRLVQGSREGVQTVVVVLRREHRQVPVEDLYDELWDVRGLPLLLLGLLDQQRQHPVERPEELPGVKDDLLGLSRPPPVLLRLLDRRGFMVQVLYLAGRRFFQVHSGSISIQNITTPLFPLQYSLPTAFPIPSQQPSNQPTATAISFAIQQISMSSYLQKYHLHKVEPVRSRPKANLQHNRFRPKSDKINSVKIPLRQKQTLHRHYFQREEHRPVQIAKTEQLIRSNQTYSHEHQRKKEQILRRSQEEAEVIRSQESMSFKSLKDNSAGKKIIASIQDFFGKMLRSDNGCSCSSPCPYADSFFQWVDVSHSIVKSHYYDMLHQYQQLMSKSSASSRCSIESALSASKLQSSSLQEQLRKGRAQIDKDIDRTQSESATFQNPVFKERMRNILTCYGYEDPQIGYIQGMNMILSGLLFHLKDEVKTYAVFRKLIFSVRSVYLNGFLECYDHIAQINRQLQLHVTDLYLLFEELGVDLNVVCLPWVLSLLTCLVPLEHLHLLYEGLMAESWQFFYKASLAIILYHKDVLLQSNDCSQILMLFSPTNDSRLQHDWQDILTFAKTLKL